MMRSSLKRVVNHLNDSIEINCAWQVSVDANTFNVAFPDGEEEEEEEEEGKGPMKFSMNVMMDSLLNCFHSTSPPAHPAPTTTTTTTTTTRQAMPSIMSCMYPSFRGHLMSSKSKGNSHTPGEEE